MKTTGVLAAFAAVTLTACGGGNSSSGDSGGTQAAPTSGGIWIGTDSATGMQITALIDETGDVVAIRSDAAQFIGTLSMSGGALSGNLDGITQFGSAFPDGSIHGTGSLSGTVVPHSSITATIHFTTDRGEATVSNVSLSFQSLYLQTPSLPALAGNYTDAQGDTISINSDGTVTAQAPLIGCVVNGDVLKIRADINLWQEQIDYANCTGSDAPLNGLELVGFAMFDPSKGSALVGMHDSSGHHYGIVLQLRKQ